MTEIEELNARIEGLLRELAEARDVLRAEEAKAARRKPSLQKRKPRHEC